MTFSKFKHKIMSAGVIELSVHVRGGSGALQNKYEIHTNIHSNNAYRIDRTTEDADIKKNNISHHIATEAALNLTCACVLAAVVAIACICNSRTCTCLITCRSRSTCTRVWSAG